MWSGPPVLSVFTMSNSRRFALPAVVAMIAAAVASRALRSFSVARMSLTLIRATIVSSSVPSNGREAKRREPRVRIAAPFACHDAAREKHLTEVLRAQ
jgi:hypothetical protein